MVVELQQQVMRASLGKVPGSSNAYGNLAHLRSPVTGETPQRTPGRALMLVVALLQAKHLRQPCGTGTANSTCSGTSLFDSRRFDGFATPSPDSRTYI